MRIVLVSPFLPYAGVRHGGGKVVFHLLRVLAERHEVHLVSRVFPEERGRLEAVSRLVASLHVVDAPSSSVGRSPGHIAGVVTSYWRLCALARRVVAQVRAEIVQVEFTETGVFWRTLPGIPSVITCIDILAKPAARRADESRGFGRLWLTARAGLVRRFEGMAIARFDRVFVLSAIDRDLAALHYPRAQVRVIDYPADASLQDIRRAPDLERVLYVGALNRVENQLAVEWLLTHCWPRVRTSRSAATLDIVGHGAPPELGSRWSTMPGVTVHGGVDSVAAFYETATLVVAPILTGGGIIVKVLDALAARVALVTTSRGDEGVGAGRHGAAWVADDPEDFARGIVMLLGDPVRREAMEDAGRRLLATERSPEAFARTVETTYAELVAAHRPGPLDARAGNP